MNLEIEVGTVHPLVGPVYRDEGLAEIAQGRFASPVERLLGDPDPHSISFRNSTAGRSLCFIRQQVHNVGF